VPAAGDVAGDELTDGDRRRDRAAAAIATIGHLGEEPFFSPLLRAEVARL
jgi:hypothetical protein